MQNLALSALAGSFLLGSYKVGSNKKTDCRNVLVKSDGGFTTAPSPLHPTTTTQKQNWEYRIAGCFNY